MKACVYVALDLLLEALFRRWLLAMVLGISGLALVLGYSLQLEIVEGVIAGSQLFGSVLGNTMGTVDGMLRPILQGLCWAVYGVGLTFGILSTANFAPELLAPGRVEHLLSLPVHRWQLILGTYLGVMVVAIAGATYAGSVLTVLIGAKTGVWSLALIGSALGACLAFTAVYGLMLMTAVFVRSPGLSAAMGQLLIVLGAALPHRELAAMFDPGWSRAAYVASVSWLPRFSSLGGLGLGLDGLAALPADALSAAVAAPMFGLACVAVAVWQFERRDY